MIDAARLVGVTPASEFHERTRLFSALERVFPVRFTALSEAPPDDFDAIIAVGVEPPEGRPAFVVAADSGQAVSGSRIDIRAVDAADPRLRGRSMEDDTVEGAPAVAVRSGDTVVASVGDAPVWVERAQGRQTVVARGPEELSHEASMRAQLAPGRWFGMVPIVSFLRRIVAGADLVPPRPRACFVLDDPNLHASSYGYLGYRELIGHAIRLGHHTSIAMIPVDAYFARGSVVDLFRQNATHLSLSVHGNDHRKHELDSFADAAEREEAFIRALQRIERFERRTGLEVDRVMVPPHEAASFESVVDLARTGFEAATMTRTEPWAGPWPGVSALAGWLPGHLAAGVPVIQRFPLGTDTSEIALHAFLDQPLVVYGHHWDLKDGLDLLETYVRDFARLDGLTWSSLREIARSNYASRSEGTTLAIRPYASSIVVDVPVGIESIRFDLPATFGWCAPDELVVAIDGNEMSAGERGLPVCGRSSNRVRIDLVHPSSVPASLPSGVGRRQAWPVVRRLLTEARDRTTPAVDRLLRR